MFGYLDAAVRFGLQVLGYRAHVDFSQRMQWIVPTGCPLAPHRRADVAVEAGVGSANRRLRCHGIQQQGDRHRPLGGHGGNSGQDISMVSPIAPCGGCHTSQSYQAGLPRAAPMGSRLSVQSVIDHFDGQRDHLGVPLRWDIDGEHAHAFGEHLCEQLSICVPADRWTARPGSA